MAFNYFSGKRTAEPEDETPPEGVTCGPDLQAVRAQAFDPAFYLSHYPDVAEAQVDPLAHYCTNGWREGRRPNSWFDPVAYCISHPGLNSAETDPFLHFLQHRDTTAEQMQDELEKIEENKVLLWTGMSLQDEAEEKPRPIIVSSDQPKGEALHRVRAAFDEEYYLERNPDVAATGVHPLTHFMVLGWLEGRDPSPGFSVSYYLRNNPDVRKSGVNPFDHYLQTRAEQKWRKSASVEEARVLTYFAEDEAMQARVAAAEALEPMVALPDSPRHMTGIHLAAKSLADAAEAIRAAVGPRRRRYVVAIPHIRMSGATRVASIFVRALAALRPADEILVITTDKPENAYPHWFPPGVDLVDISAPLEKLPLESQIRCLIDLMRGVDCEALFNVNSRLAWEGLQLFGRQLSQEFCLATYFFTWDETKSGKRVGYPVQWLNATSDVHHVLFTDTRMLARDIAGRFGFSGSEVVPLRTPATETGLSAPQPALGAPPRFLWAGRFDRQKRLDVLVRIARENPHMIFDVYGRAVLDKDGIEKHDPPPNIELKGTYSDLSEVLETAYHGFLYTAQWDGLPTILLDIAGAGLPIVAPDVGGLSELLDDDTGWLVSECDDVAGYSAALRDMAGDPDAARARAARLRTKLARDFSGEAYSAAIEKVLDQHGL